MNKIYLAVHKIRTIEELARRDQWVNKLHPLVKFIMTISFLVCLISVHRFDLEKLMYLAVILYVCFLTANLSLVQALKRIWYIIPLLIVGGIANPILDRKELELFAGVMITSGQLSFFVLLLKGMLSVLMSYFLIATTTMEELTAALYLIKVPRSFILIILFVYRYLFLLMEETGQVLVAYQLRNSGSKGIHYKEWGSLVGLLLLRTIKRGEECYQSMRLRGYQGGFYTMKSLKVNKTDLLSLGAYALLLYLVFHGPVFVWIGSWLEGVMG